MQNEKYLIFRTDRVGDFLFTLKLIHIIKLNDPKSKITIIASEKNYEYIQTFKNIDKIILLKNNLFSKIKLIFYLRKYDYKSIVVHDGKNRSKFISFFLKFENRAICVTNLIDTQLDIIEKACQKIKIKFDPKCINFLEKRDHFQIKIPFKNYIHFHFDEKWKHSDYIKKYVNIEPNEEDLISFIENIIKKDKKVIITTGKKPSVILNNIKNRIDNSNVKIFNNQSLLEIENIVFNCDLLITCHGWISHIASAKKIRQIDIIDSSYPYNKWTSHFRNYNYLNRKPFNDLSKEILNLI